VVVTVGGTIRADDIAELEGLGVCEVFTWRFCATSDRLQSRRGRD
jgi:hypothetical protein